VALNTITAPLKGIEIPEAINLSKFDSTEY
jgi:hypothetical protein